VRWNSPSCSRTFGRKWQTSNCCLRASCSKRLLSIRATISIRTIPQRFVRTSEPASPALRRCRRGEFRKEDRSRSNGTPRTRTRT